jgi:serine/threonine-protein kinase HipA
LRPSLQSLPIGPSREITGAPGSSYFENLLPENDNIRRRLSARFRTRGTEAFELLTAIGRDCVGAAQLLPPDTAPEGFDRVDGVPVNDTEVERLLRSLTAEPFPGTNEDPGEFRISIAGAQEKTALLCQRGKWFRPRGATPTTHILKLPLGVVGGGLQLDMSESVENVPPSLAAVEKRPAPDFRRILRERVSNGMLSQADVFKNATLGVRDSK